MTVLRRRRHKRLWMMWPVNATNHVCDTPYGANVYGFSAECYPIASYSRRECLERFREVIQKYYPDLGIERHYEPRRSAITYELLDTPMAKRPAPKPKPTTDKNLNRTADRVISRISQPKPVK